MGIMRVSNSFNFEKKIKSFCQLPRYDIEELEEDFAIVNILELKSDIEGDHLRFFTIDVVDDIVRFGMPSPVLFEANEIIPDSLSTILLKINSYSSNGFWCLQEMDEEGSHSFIYVYNTPKMSLNKKQFDGIVDELIMGCHIFDQLLDDILTGRIDDDDDDDDDDLEDDSENFDWNDHEDLDDDRQK